MSITELAPSPVPEIWPLKHVVSAHMAVSRCPGDQISGMGLAIG